MKNGILKKKCPNLLDNTALMNNKSLISRVVEPGDNDEEEGEKGDALIKDLVDVWTNKDLLLHIIEK